MLRWILKIFRRGYLPLVLVFPGRLVVLNVSAASPDGYYLVWADEFSGSSLDLAKWGIWFGPSRDAVNTPDAVTVGDGHLTITTYTANGTHYSGIISSEGKVRADYGYYEASIEFSGSPGMWSAFWLNSPTTGRYIGDPSASGVEIDICEHRKTDTGNVDNIDDVVQTTVHWDGYGADHKRVTSGNIGSGLGTGFHTYGFFWQHTNYSFTIDGTPQWSTAAAISDRTEVITLSSEVQSNYFAGIVPPGGYGNFLTSTTKMVVDYVRYYAPTSTVFWTGATSTDWITAGNWLANRTPNASNDVVFSYLSVGNFSVSLEQNTTVRSLSIQEAGPISITGNTLTLNSGGIDMLSGFNMSPAFNDATINSALVLGAAQGWKIGEGRVLTVNGVVGGAGNLTLNGRGTVILAAANACSGPTTISNGTLLVNGVITNPVTVAGGTLSGTGTVTGPVVVNAGTLSGTGTMTGPVVVNAFGALSPGPSIGTLTLSNTLTLQPGSLTTLDINKSTGACDQIIGLTSIAYGGTLVIGNQAGVLAAGDSFNVFNARNYSGAFTRISPPTPGNGLAWDADALAANGTLRVITTSNAPITAQLAGPQLTLSWPSNNTGWRLQSQTNAPGVGLTTNWITVPGSAGTNRMIFTINPAFGSVFFRLVSPSFSTAVFSSGDLVVLQVGNGSIPTSGAPGFLNDYSPFGGPSPVQVALPTTGANALIFGGSSYLGALSLSGDGQTLVVAGYNVPVGYIATAIDTSSTSGAAPVPRAVGSVSADGKFTLNATTAQFSGGTIRSAVADGTGNFWAGGGNSGIVYLGSNSPAATISTVSTATRNLGFVNGSIYFTETGSGHGVMAFSGAPKTGATPALVLSTDGTGTGTPSPKGFAFNTGLTIAYVADNRTAANGGGIQRFNRNGSAWVYAYTLGYTSSPSQQVWDMTVDFSGPNPIIYAITGESTGNHLVSVTDSGPGSAFTILETAPPGTAFRDVAFAPGQVAQ
jgi:autotransporter-associated beta strand protein